VIAADGSSQGEPSHPTRLARTAHGSGRVTGPLGGRFFCVCPGCQATASTAGAGRSAGRSNKAAQGAPIKKPRRRQGLSRNASGSLSSFRPRKWCPALLTRTDLTVGGKGEARAGGRSANWHSTGTPRGAASCRPLVPPSGAERNHLQGDRALRLQLGLRSHRRQWGQDAAWAGDPARL